MADSAKAYPRLMVAAPYGKSGKTVITSGLLRALRNQGVDVRPYKKGPDYIDPGWHTLACGMQSRNLDPFFMSGEQMRAVMAQASNGARLSVVEGAMGLHDGSDLDGSTSSAHVAKLTETPVVLVVDVTRMTRTTAAVVLGCMHLDPDLNVSGVILNRVRGKRHETRIREAVEHFCGIPVVGAIPEDNRLVLPDRHLGLVTALEARAADAFLDGAASVIAAHVDWDALFAIADSAPDFKLESHAGCGLSCEVQPDSMPVNIAVVRDDCFSFYYQENLDALVATGAHLVFVNSLEDEGVPENADGLYIGGGFPEVFAEQLEANARFRESVRERIRDGIACCAECGGLMFLGRSLVTDGKTYNMTGALGFDVEMMEERQGHGYSVVEVNDGHPWLDAGTQLVGHEHHHSRVKNVSDELEFAYSNKRGGGISGKRDGLSVGRTVASYVHVNAIASPQWAKGFVQAAVSYRNSKNSAGC